MSMKTILVPMENYDALHSTLETALLLLDGATVTWKDSRFAGRSAMLLELI
jgi:hypothetical protein